MHGQSGAPSLPPINSQNVVEPFDTHGGIASSTTVNLGDAPPALGGKQLARLNLAVREIDLTDQNGKTKVFAQYAEPLIVDVLQYQDGGGATVARGANSGGQTYTQIRVIIEVTSSQAIYTDNTAAALDFTDAATLSSVGAGATTVTTTAYPGTVAITTNQEFTTNASLSNVINVDFNTFESLALEANDSLSVRPALFVAASDAGAIAGTVVGKNGKPVSNATVVATASDGSVGNTVATDASGNFNLHTLAAGTYSLQIRNSYTNAAGANITAQGGGKGISLGPTVTVTSGQVTDAGTITD